MNKKVIIYTDGGARGNPGPAGIGAVIKSPDGKVLKEISEYVGEATNNKAEYIGAVRALEEAVKLGVNEIDLFMDSELIVKQLRGEYKVKNKDLAPFFLKIHNLKVNLKKFNVSHIRREMNKEADKLANEAMDRGN